MTVYVESNFVLELALGQQQVVAAEEILNRAERREIELAFPSFSLSEPFHTISLRIKRRKKLSNEFDNQLRDLRRSFTHEDDAASLEPLESVLAQVSQRETDRLIAVIERLLAASTSIQVDLPTYRAALRYRSRYGLSEQDAIIYSAAISHLSQNQSTGPHYFISRDNDFDDPGVAAELGRFDCSFVRSFNEGALRLDQRPGL